MANTDSLDVVAQALVNKITTAAAGGLLHDALGDTILQPANVFYGDQSKYPAVPAVAIEPNSRPRTLNGLSFRTDNNFTVYILCYHNQLDQSIQKTRQQIQQLSENIETLIHQDPQLGGLLVHCFCENNESGYTYRSGTLYRSNRITFSGYSKTMLRNP
jgi:hypothetical protein